MGLLIINTSYCINASELLKNNNELLALKQNCSNTFAIESNTSHISNKNEARKEDEKETNKVDNSNVKNEIEVKIDNNKNKDQANNIHNSTEKKIANCSNSAINSIDPDKLFENWTYDKDNIKKSNTNKISDTKQQYLNLMNDLRKDDVKDNIKKPITTLREKNNRKSSISSNGSSHFSNPLIISNQNKFKLADDYFSTHEELIPIIILQSDGMQVLDTIAHLSAFNDFYKLSNFGTCPYIYCASSAALPGLSLAYDLSNNTDPMTNLNKIGDELCKLKNSEKNAKIQNNNKKKCCCSMNCFKLCWMKLFGCCTNYDNEIIIDSLYTKINDNVANSIVKNIIGLNKTSSIKLPNFVIEDIKSNNSIVEQVLQANSNQNVIARNNQIRLFTDPIIAVIKKYISKNKESNYNEKLEKGVNFINNNIQSDDLSKITEKEEIQFIENNNLHDNNNNRLVIMLSSNVNNDNQITCDTNNINIEYKELEHKKFKNKLHAIVIRMFTGNCVTNKNYSLEEKYNNIKSILNSSEEFLHLIEKLPQQISSEDNSKNDIVNNTEMNNILNDNDVINNINKADKQNK